jgi:hypothetical protein
MVKIGSFDSNLEGMFMSRKAQLHHMVDNLKEQDERMVYDFLHYLIQRYRNPYYKIDQLEPDDIPLNEEERAQLDSGEERASTVSLEALSGE